MITEVQCLHTNWHNCHNCKTATLSVYQSKASKSGDTKSDLNLCQLKVAKNACQKGRLEHLNIFIRSSERYEDDAPMKADWILTYDVDLILLPNLWWKLYFKQHFCTENIYGLDSEHYKLNSYLAHATYCSPQEQYHAVMCHIRNCTKCRHTRCYLE